MPTKKELNTQIRNLQAKIAQMTAEDLTEDAAHAATVANLQSQLDGLNNQLANERQEDIAEDAAYVRRIKELEAEVEELKNPPKPPTGTRFGVTVTGGVKKNMPDLHDDVKVSRVFLAGTRSWPNDGQHKAFPKSRWAVSCSYELPESEVPALLDSAEDDWDQWEAFADGHELENPDKNLKPADVKARQTRTSKLIRARGLRVASCLMQWTLAPASGRNWLDWVNPDAIDIFCWDAYNSGAKKQTYTDPDNMLDRIIAISKEYGKPWALWETGTNNFGDQGKRVAWTNDLHDTIIREGGEHAIWFDRPSTSGSSWDATLDRPTAEAWLR